MELRREKQKLAASEKEGGENETNPVIPLLFQFCELPP